MRLPSGSRLGPYEIVAPLGAGGMGEVYRAKDTRLDRTVAIKIISTMIGDRPETRQRFEREARTISSLSHPHICPLFDVGQQDGVEYLVMEFLEGETLAARVAKGALPIDQVLRYAIEIASALDAAHRQGIVHRDLKPGNVMLTKAGAKLLDFGLAKALGPPTVAGGVRLRPDQTMEPTVAAPITSEGTIVGTFNYMAPEQLEGRDVDARADLFAFGALVYEMATGRRAFDGATQATVIAAIIDREPPPMTTLRPLAPTALEHIVRRALAKDPDERWQTARDLLAGLQWIGTGSADEPKAVGRTRSFVLVASLLATLAGAVIVAWLIRGSPVATSVAVRFLIDAPKSQGFGSVALSPDGRTLAAVVF